MGTGVTLLLFENAVAEVEVVDACASDGGESTEVATRRDSTPTERLRGTGGRSDLDGTPEIDERVIVTRFKIGVFERLFVKMFGGSIAHLYGGDETRLIRDNRR